MSTSEYEQNEYSATSEVDGESRSTNEPTTPCHECFGEFEPLEESRPRSALSEIQTLNSLTNSRPDSASESSKFESPRTIEKEEPNFSPSFNLSPQFPTECDLETTQAPPELLPQIESTPTTSKIEEKPIVSGVAETKKEPLKKRALPVKSRINSGIPRKTDSIQLSNSSIPVKINKPASRLSMKPSKTSSLCRSLSRTPRTNLNKHTLEIQFLNKHKRLVQYKNDLIEKQRPVMDLYQNLLEIKKQLAEFGKAVEIDEIKLVAIDEPKQKTDHPCGDVLNQEIVENMKSSIENIPKALMDVCQNLVERRAALVDLLESVSQANIEPLELADKIEPLKNEGKELKESLDALITRSEKRITELLQSWYLLLDSKKQAVDHETLEGYKNVLLEKEAIIKESKQVICDLQKKLEDKRNHHEKIMSEYEITLKEYTDSIKRLSNELETEKKNASEIKSRSAGNSQIIKSLKQKLKDATDKLKDYETKNDDLTKKLKSSQDQQRQRESVWNKEKDELQKNIKEHDKLVNKLTEDRSRIQTRLDEADKERVEEECTLKKQVGILEERLNNVNEDLRKCKGEKMEIEEKYQKLQNELARVGNENRKNMNEISKQMEWGKSLPCTDAQAELYSELLATKVTLREYEEKIKNYEKENVKWTVERAELIEKVANGSMHVTPDIRRQEELVTRYKNLLEECEMKLTEKSVEVAKLNAEIKHLKIRQDAIEEQNSNCPTDELKKMVAEGRQKLSELMKKSMENEQKVACYESTIEKQHKQMNEMENLLRVRDGLIGMIKAKKDELLMEKDSLTRYCKDVRNMLAETREDLRVKSEVIRDLQDKLDKKEKTIVILEKKVIELEENLSYTNEKRFKLQDTISSMEKELQTTKAHVNQMAELKSRYDLGMTNSKSHNLTLSSQNPTFESLTFHQNTEFNLDLPIREMDCIRRRLYKLSNFELPVSLSNTQNFNNKTKSCNVLHSTKSLYSFTNKTNYQRMIELESKRYQILQKQTEESYENLSNLLRLSMPSSDRETTVKERNSESEITSLVTECEQPVKAKFSLNPKLHFNKIYLTHLSETYKDLNESLTIIKNTLTEVDEMKNSP